MIYSVKSGKSATFAVNFYGIKTMKEKINEFLPWQAMGIACEGSDLIWVTMTGNILKKLQSCDFSVKDFGDDEQVPIDTYERIVKVFEDELVKDENCEYYLRLSRRFTVFQTIVGLLVSQMSGVDQKLKCILSKLSVAIVVCSLRQPPYTMPVWKQMADEYVRVEVEEDFRTIVNLAENLLMLLSGQSIYSFFQDTCSKEEIHEMLAVAHEHLKQEDEVRRYTIKHGHGHSKMIIGHALGWMAKGKMKSQHRIYPLIKSLSAYWHHEFNLGSSQGTERMYRKMRDVYEV